MARSGTVEPTWPTKEGATVVEEVDLTPTAITVTPTNPVTPGLPEGTRDRYGLRTDLQYEP